MKLKITLIILVVLVAHYVVAGNHEDKPLDFKNVKVLRVYDGDTIFVNINKIPPVLGYDLGVRLRGIDTPEIRGKCDHEKELAKQAKILVLEKIIKNKYKVDLKNCERGKYFRIVCDVYAPDNIGDMLIENNLAYDYEGGTKIDWCADQ